MGGNPSGFSMQSAFASVLFCRYFTLQLNTFDHSPKYVMPLNS